MAELDFDDDQQDFAETVTPQEAPSFWANYRIPLIVSSVGMVVLAGVYFMFFASPSDSDSLKAKRKMSSLQDSPNKEKVEEIAQKEKTEARKKVDKKIKYVKLYDLSIDETAKALKELSMADIPFTTEQKGKNFALSVDEKKMEEAKNLLAIKGLPGGSNKGYELLDNSQTLGVTEFDKRVRFVRALSGELEKAILQFEMIENCKVQIVLPEQRLFAVTQPPVTASILVRKYPGTAITDDVVFSIIQLVANAVENLQPENVSVIDTEGKVLSNGIFERMAAKDARRNPVVSSPNAVKLEENTPIGTPIIPNFDEIKKWQEVKQKYEASLENRAYDQLIGILPEGSFKIAINADLGPLENGEIVDIKRLTTSIVVDNSRQDIFLDQVLKKQIFNTIASAIGYVKGRDTIQLNKADFRLLSEEERKKLVQRQKWRKIINFLSRMAPYTIGVVASLGAGYTLWRRLRKNRVKTPDEMMGSFDRDTDFSSLQDELNPETQIQEIREYTNRDPQAIANLIESWVTE